MPALPWLGVGSRRESFRVPGNFGRQTHSVYRGRNIGRGGELGGSLSFEYAHALLCSCPLRSRDRHGGRISALPQLRIHGVTACVASAGARDFVIVNSLGAGITALVAVMLNDLLFVTSTLDLSAVAMLSASGQVPPRIIWGTRRSHSGCRRPSITVLPMSASGQFQKWHPGPALLSDKRPSSTSSSSLQHAHRQREPSNVPAECGSSVPELETATANCYSA